MYIGNRLYRRTSVNCGHEQALPIQHAPKSHHLLNRVFSLTHSIGFSLNNSASVDSSGSFIISD